MGNAVITYLFEEYNPTCIFAEMDVRNQASIRLVEKLGFTRTILTIEFSYGLCWMMLSKELQQQTPTPS